MPSEDRAGTTAVERARRALAVGEVVAVVNDLASYESTALVAAADQLSTETMGFLVRHTSGIVCISLPEEQLRRLGLLPMVPASLAEPDPERIAFTVSVDAAQGTTTGISARDRAVTVKALIDPRTTGSDLARPGHVFPVQYREGGVVRHAGYAEAAVDLARVAGSAPAGVFGELVRDDGSLPGVAEVERFAEEHGLPVVEMADIIRYRSRRERLARTVGTARLPTVAGEVTAVVVESAVDGTEHMAFVRGDVAGREDVPTWVHRECIVGDVFRSGRCECRVHLDELLRALVAEDLGVVVYLRGRDGRGVGLTEHLGVPEGATSPGSASRPLVRPVELPVHAVARQILIELGVVISTARTTRGLGNVSNVHGDLPADESTVDRRGTSA